MIGDTQETMAWCHICNSGYRHTKYANGHITFAFCGHCILSKSNNVSIADMIIRNWRNRMWFGDEFMNKMTDEDGFPIMIKRSE